MVKLLKIKRRDFFQWDSIPILVSRTMKTRKFKLLYFQNETCFGAGNLYKDLFSIYLQPSVRTNSWNLAFLTLQSGDVTAKTISRRPQQTFERWTPRTHESSCELVRQSDSKRKQAPQSEANVCRHKSSPINCTGHPRKHKTTNKN